MNMWKKILSTGLSTALAVSLLAGCQSGNGNENGSGSTAATEKETAAESQTEAEGTEAGQTGPIVLTDQAGRSVTLEAPAERIVSSYYISTALLVALGLEDHLTAIEKKADTRELYKLASPGLLELPGVGTSKEINVEETAATEPGLVVLPLRLKDSTPSFEELNIPVLVVNPETQEDFEACLALLAQATGTEERGAALLSCYHEKMQEARELVKDLERPSVYFSSSSDYFSTCTASMYQNDLIGAAGGRNVSESLEDGYWKVVSPEEILEWNPQYMFFTADAEYSREDILADEALSAVDAVKNGNVFRFPSVIEAWDYPTPSSVLGVLWLTHMLHPEVYSMEQYLEEARDFYSEFFGISVTDQQLGV